MGWSRKGPGRGLCDGKQKQKCVCGQQNGSQGYFLKPMFIKKKGEKPWRQLGRHGISLVKKKKRKYKYVQKENILQAIHSNVSSGCSGVWIMNHLFLSSIFLIFVKQT